MTTSIDKWRKGDWVEVKNAREIALTLDANGTLDGLPFMPEMLHHCGRRYRVHRLAQKTCLESGGEYLIREFRNNDVVLLENLRCSGTDHGGCQRRCMFFWKTAWLRRVAAGGPGPTHVDDCEDFRPNLTTRIAPDRYFCQSTELSRATRPQSLTKREILLKCIWDVRSGAVSVLEMASLIVVPAYRKVRDALMGRPRLVGKLTETPVGNLGLQAGELVEIRSQDDMRKTLDRRGRNRGLVCDIELRKFCGTQDRVLGRLERMISESTGQMRKVEATVILEGNKCMCARALGGCPREDFCYWREVWLKRVGEPTSELPLAGPPQNRGRLGSGKDLRDEIPVENG